jgi:hypothetical protein
MAVVCAVFTGCAARHTLPVTAAVTPDTSSFIDLKPGWRLRVVTPILKSGGYRLKPAAQEVSGSTVTLSVGSEFLGYEVAYYGVRPRGVDFLSAEITREGKAVPQTQPIAHLFELPHGIRHVRLIYLLRASQADHDMAVAAAKEMPALEALTQRVLANPADGCKNDGGAVCSWIPGGIAVVPELKKKTDGAVEWIPAR